MRKTIKLTLLAAAILVTGIAVFGQAVRIPVGLLDTNAAAPALVRGNTGSFTSVNATTGAVAVLVIGGTNYTVGITAVVDTAGATNLVLKLTP